MSHPAIAIVVMLLCVVAVVAILAVFMAGSDTRPDSEIAADIVAPVAIATAYDNLPNVEYAGLRVALVESRAVPDNRSGTPIVVVDLAVTNTSRVQARLPRSMFRLVFADGTPALLSRFEHGAYSDRLVIEPAQTTRALAVFYLPPWVDLELDEYSLEFGEKGRRPVELPLDGSDPVTQEPRLLASTASVVGDAADGANTDGSPVRTLSDPLQLLSANSQGEFGRYRARADHQVIVMEFDASSLAEAERSQLADIHRWRVIGSRSNGEAPEVGRPIHVAVDGAVLTVVGSSPVDASEIELTLEIDGATREVARLDIPEAG